VAAKGHTVFGLHASEAILRRRPRDVVQAYLLRGELRGRLADVEQQLRAARVTTERMAREELDRLTRGGVHQGIVLLVPAPAELGLRDLERVVADRGDKLRLLVLDQIEDPRNLGACMRTADAAGIDAIVVPKARSAKLSGAALKVATGAAETVPLVVVPNLARVLRWLADAGVRLVGAAGEGGVALFDADLKPPIALLLGAEESGLRRLSREACDELVRIPMRGTVDSLNVSVAAGIVLYEMLRQSEIKGVRHRENGV
jgi:23S rRNA (guanosine2251-2'-O)-methyltransferase